ncbi:non-ribosomal peptide synthetase [Paenibacillus mucilaginosus]|uniref:non-ribosomal peptide synthetase n=1 Tax=Paenibacillus mucilaginosus TaxID=61624 RepID=UPI001EEFFCF3|nr:non-ribosomal peptide synthetase [Paenibacillus mucilaginosus]MCG7211878.1 amino acid adenylation domain-containing protein [Paenibacillus mucilaginosus]WDM25121.1 amino acid adenylation domain-containing protein [Paenibacillus mucilaginosus]
MKWTKDQIKDVYLLSPMQQGMLFHYLMDEESLTYREQIAVELKGSLDLAYLQMSFQVLVDRHDVLRTVFVHDGVNKPMQVVLKQRSFPPIAYEDLSALGSAERRERIGEWKAAELEKGFRLSEDSLLRATVIRTAPVEYLLLWNFHHIILDGWCLGILMKELFQIYGAWRHKEPVRLEAPPQYSTYMKWLEKQDRKAAEAYWSDYVHGYGQLAELPSLPGVKNAARYLRKEGDFAFGEAETRALLSLSMTAGVTVSTLMQALWSVLLHKYTQLEDVMFGAVVSGRPAEVPGIESMIGLFINTVPVRMRMRAELPFSELLAEARRSEHRSAAHEFYPLYEIQADSLLKTGLIDHILVFENFPVEAQDEVLLRRRLGFVPGTVEAFEQTNYDLTVLFVPGDRLTVKFLYNEARFDAAFFTRLEGHLKELAAAVTADPGREIGKLMLLTDGEREQLLHRFNDTARAFPEERLIHHGFEEQARLRPDHPAVVTDSGTLTYAQLDERAGRLARRLRSAGVGPDSYVGLLLNRSDRLIVAMLGIAKAGGAYVPMEASYPAARIERILTTLGAAHLVSESALSPLWEQLPSACPQLANILCVDQDADAAEAEERASAAEAGVPAAGPHDPAYAIFTSGSTGVPKGVIVHHRSVSNLIDWVNRTTGMGPEDRVLFVTSPTFDLSVYDVFGLLTAGGTIRLVEAEDIRRPERLLELLRDEPVTCWNSAPAALQQLAPLIESHPQPVSVSLRHVLLSGDWIPLKLPGVLQRAFPGVRVLAMGGATEATVWSNVFEVGEVDPNWASIPYGRPIQNARYYILDSGLAPCPIGVPGELFIGGECLAAGYDDPALTAARFLPDPYSPREGGRMYRTGDRARWMADGNIEFLGRIDHQVKIRGYRIEPGEIQAQLAKHPAVKEVVVIDRQDAGGEKYLCAYLVTEEELTVGRLREFLGASLPEYMIPAHFVRLPAMPVTANGKLDRRSLPEPDGSIGSGTAYVAPRNETEAKLAEIWREVLQREVGVQDHFIELGGHSIKATALIARIHKIMGVSLPIRSVFQLGTVEAMARHLQEPEGDRLPPIPAAAPAAAYRVSSAQRRMFVLQQLEGEGTGYQIPGMFAVEGHVDLYRFERAWQQLIERHAALRTSFELSGGEILQRVHQAVDFRVEYTAADEAQLSSLLAAFLRPFDLSQAPLLRVGLITTAPDRHVLLFNMHHIVSDGESVRILAEEFTRLYAGGALPPSPVDYKDYAVWQQALLDSEPFRRHEDYWLAQFSEAPPLLQLPADAPRPAERSHAGDTFRFRLEPELTSRLQQLARETGTTLFMLTLAAYKVMLHKYTGQEDIVVGTPVSGRSHPDTANLVGLFVNTLALRSRPGRSLPFLQFLAAVRETALSAYEHADYPFELLVDRCGAARDISRNPLFDTMFTLQTQTADLAASGLAFQTLEIPNKAAQFDLTFEGALKKDTLIFDIEYCTDLYGPETIRRMAGHYRELLQHIVSDPSASLAQLKLLTEAEERQILHCFNPQAKQVPEDAQFLPLFRQQAEAAPDRPAVRCLDRLLTYRELDERSGRLAAGLAARGIRPESMVAILAERSVDWVVAVLAVFKAGGAYVPIDPVYPGDRIAYMLEDSGAELLLTQRSLIGTAPGWTGETVLLDDEGSYGREPAGGELPAADPSRLAYMIYTSGTTGRPKGVLVEHGSYANTILAYRERFAFDSFPVRLLQIASFSFDVFLADLARTLAFGGELVLCPEEARPDPARLYEELRLHQITVLDATPSLAVPLMEYIHERGLDTGALRLLIIGSDSCPAEEYRKLLQRFGSRLRIVNCYGVTEGCIESSCYEVPAEDFAGTGVVPIGRPFPNMKMYVVSASMQLQPVGVTGELCIGGAGIARGYHRLPELTGDRFVTDPFTPGGRMYRTGDLARWTPDGCVEFLGRADQQVKIRGFRVEPGEIESALLQHERIRQAAVMEAEEKGAKELCAYLAASGPLDLAELREHLKQRLPEVMIPAFYVVLEQLPLTSNGKIDRRSLPGQGELRRGTAATAYEPARSGTEKRLQEIWAEVLEEDRIGMHDDFFSLGGSSLKAARMASLASAAFGVEVPLRTVMRHPTIRGLASALFEDAAEAGSAVLWNEAGSPNLFSFPPLLGYGMVFQTLAACLQGEFTLYAFDFLPAGDRIVRYADEIVSLQGEGPYRLLGYSAGGNLAFEVAAELERRGLVVSDLVLIDSVHLETGFSPSELSLEEEIRVMLQEVERSSGKLEESFLAECRGRIRAYAEYLDGLVHEDCLRADLHCIRSENRSLEAAAVIPWSLSTYGFVTEYEGAGAHLEMLSTDYAARNAGVILAALQAPRDAMLVQAGDPS